MTRATSLRWFRKLWRLLLCAFVAAFASVASAAPTLVVNDARPVAQAIQQLTEKYGAIITYEDPRYSYDGDLQDVTEQVRNDLAKFAPGKAPKIIVPKGGALSIDASSGDVETILNKLVQAQSRASAGGHFRVEHIGNAYHVVPTEIRDKKGNWTAQSSILDKPITLLMQDRDELAMMKAICGAITSATGEKVFLAGRYSFFGGISESVKAADTQARPSSPSEPARNEDLAPSPYPKFRLGAQNEPARSVLTRALDLAQKETRGETSTWFLYYSVEDKQRGYYLNIMGIPNRPAPTGQGVSKVSPRK
jgi:hypothetical protein